MMTRLEVVQRPVSADGHLYAASVGDDGSVVVGGATTQGGILVTLDAAFDAVTTSEPLVSLAPAEDGGHFFCDGSNTVGRISMTGQTSRTPVPMKRALSVVTTTNGVWVSGYAEAAEPYSGDWFSDPYHFDPEVLHETVAGSPDVPTCVLAYAKRERPSDALVFDVLEQPEDFSLSVLPCSTVEPLAMMGVWGRIRRPRLRLWLGREASTQKAGLKSGDFNVTGAVVTATGAILVADNVGRVHRSINEGDSFRKTTVVDTGYVGVNTLVPLSNGWIVAAGDGGVIAVSESDGRTFEVVQAPVGEGRATSWHRGGFHYYTGAPLGDGFVLAGTRGRLDHCRLI